MPVTDFSLRIVVDGTDEYTFKSVEESLDKIDGITGRSFSVGTNYMTVSAKWEESDVSRKIEQIRNINNVIKVDYNKSANISILEPTIQVSENVSGTLWVTCNWRTSGKVIAEAKKMPGVTLVYKAQKQTNGPDVIVNMSGVDERRIKEAEEHIKKINGVNTVTHSSGRSLLH
jgi:nitrate reductase NapAB chaperone NapD